MSKESELIMPRRNFHRVVFCTAGVYNICWGLFSAAFPQWLFRLAHMPLDNHPQIFAAMAMVVGLYGVVYFEVARVPERGWVLAAVGFVGKVLGPIGLAQLILTHVWPVATCVLSLTNDIIWLPFFRSLSLGRLAAVPAGFAGELVSVSRRRFIDGNIA